MDLRSEDPDLSVNCQVAEALVVEASSVGCVVIAGRDACHSRQRKVGSVGNRNWQLRADHQQVFDPIVETECSREDRVGKPTFVEVARRTLRGGAFESFLRADPAWTGGRSQNRALEKCLHPRR